jgi:hypothetical protein
MNTEKQPAVAGPVEPTGRHLPLAGVPVEVRGYQTEMGGLYRSEKVAHSVAGDPGELWPLVRLEDAHRAALDCRTCRHHTTATDGCVSVLQCREGSAYQRAGVRQCWTDAERGNPGAAVVRRLE